jgi:hypothetical protein
MPGKLWWDRSGPIRRPLTLASKAWWPKKWMSGSTHATVTGQVTQAEEGADSPAHTGLSGGRPSRAGAAGQCPCPAC